MSNKEKEKEKEKAQKFKQKFKNIFEPKILSSTWEREGMEVSIKNIYNSKFNNKDNIQKR